MVQCSECQSDDVRLHKELRIAEYTCKECGYTELNDEEV